MSKRKKIYIKHQGNNDDYTDIPSSLLGLFPKLSPGAICMAMYLCYLFDHVSKAYPPIELLAKSQKMSVAEVESYEAQLVKTGFLTKNSDGSFALKGKEGG